MRILFVVHQFLPEFASGTERVALNLAHAAQRAGHRADILTWSMDPDAGWTATREGLRETAVEGLRVTAIPNELTPDPHGFEVVGSPLARQAVDGFLDSNRYDAVHVLHGLRMADALARIEARGLPMVVTVTDFFGLCHRVNLRRVDGTACAGPDGARACVAHCSLGPTDESGFPRRYQAWRQMLQRARFRVACSPFVAEIFAREHPDLPLQVIPHGIDWRAAPTGRSHGAQPVFGYVGTVSEEKGVGLLARAFAATDIAATLELVGPVAGETDCLAGIDDPRIVRRGALSAAEVAGAMAGFDVLCLPTRLPETFSLALHEGFAAGLPCLVSDLGHPAAVVRDAGCGLVLPAGDEAAWSAGIAAAASLQRRQEWQARLPLPWRVEEEAFLYSQLYKACISH